MAVRRICSAGNRVVFDEEGSDIEDKASRAKATISKEDRIYAARVWVKVPEEAVRSNNRFHALESVDEEEEIGFVETGFTRLAAKLVAISPRKR